MKTRLSILLTVITLLLFPLSANSQGSGYCLEFDGIDDAVVLGDSVCDHVRTIEMWFMPAQNITSSNSNVITLIGRDFNNGSALSTNEFTLCFSTTSWGNAGKIMWGRRVGSSIHRIYSNDNYWAANHWYHVAVTMDTATGMKMYINGVLQQDTESSGNSIGAQSGSSTDVVSIGKWGYINNRYFKGKIDEVRLWETARTPTQIQQNMCQKVPTGLSSLRALYRFDNGTGSILYDISNNIWNGTIVGSASPQWMFSGAPIGDASGNLYVSTGLSSQSLTLTSALGDIFKVDNFNTTAKGVHIYKVNTVPNTVNGLTNPLTGNYYGVFLTDTSGTFSCIYDYSAYTCTNCDRLYTRNDNSGPLWTIIPTAATNCTFTILNQSTVGNDYRAEFIVDNGVSVPGNFLGPDTSMCDGDTLLKEVIFPFVSSYLWDNGNTTNTRPIWQTGLYNLEMVDSSGCILRDTFFVQFHPTPVISLGNDTAICLGQMITINATHPDATTYTWQDGTTNPIYQINLPGTYWVDLNTYYGCIATDTLKVSVLPPPVTDLGNDTMLCTNESLLLDAFDVGLSDYEWQDGSANSNFTVNSAGTYWVKITDTVGCIGGDTILVTYLNKPFVSFPGDTLLCMGKSLNLDATNPASTYLWQDNTTLPTYSITVSGTYSVVATNNCGADSASITVDFEDCRCKLFVPNAFTPDGDGLNDELKVYYYCDYEDFEIKIFNRWGKCIYISNDINGGWDGSFDGTLCPLGTYSYIIRMKYPESDKFSKRGSIILIR